MIKTNQVFASRSSAGKSSTVHKVFGDPSVIKMNDHPPSRNPRSGPLQASDLMALEEDINDEQQQEDSKRLARFMSEDLKDQVFTDISIQCKNREFKIHKEYLLAFTTYDIPVLPGETLHDIPALNLSDLDSSDVATVLHFLYYGELKLNAYNILGIRAAVQALGVTDLPAIIQEFHDKLFTPPNMINLIEFAQGRKLQDLFTYSWKLFIAMFYEHVNGAHFLNWDVKWVLNLLSHENLPIRTELEVFEAGRLWLNHRPEERSDDVKAVLLAVRWTYMSAEEMVECEREDPTIMSRFEAHELVSDANWYKVMMRNGVPWSDFNIPPPRGTDPGGGPPVFRPPRPPLQTVSNFRLDDRDDNASPSPLSQSTWSERNLAHPKSVSRVRSNVSTRSRESNRVNFAEDHTGANEVGSESSFNSLDIDMSNLSLTSLEG
ncbi:hypothetical protein RvY_12806 [Ramazzottius varieornatus]|uniref:BTB domain-containing protein n=1 Tax=Ramazzottius varieornatus TaxID=947166 RepID=A0A1D1VKR7_RAMVA|nr:hypothetical protein RvY_12806 [Ramazzottius varieornatus]